MQDNLSRGQENSPQANDQQAQDSRQPVDSYGYRQFANSGNLQQSSQQQANSQAQRDVSSQPQKPKGQTIMVGGQEIPYYPAPVGHASESVTRLQAKAREMERTAAKPDVPSSATPEALASARFVPMPPGGIMQLAQILKPDASQDELDGTVFDILTLNRDTLRDDTISQVGQMVRIPG